MVYFIINTVRVCMDEQKKKNWFLTNNIDEKLIGLFHDKTVKIKMMVFLKLN